MKLESTAFADGATIPPDHTCVGDATGKSTSPPLNWESIPSTAKSLLLLVTDASVGDDENFVQWIAYNISPTFKGLAAGIPNASIYNGFYQAANDFNGIGYAPPCPPIGDPAHTYVFTLMALDKILEQDSLTATYDNLLTNISSNLVGTASFTGTVVRAATGNIFELKSTGIDETTHEINKKFTCDGSSLSPPLEWANVPDGTLSLALTMVGTGTPDENGDFNPSACHWAAFNIPATQTQDELVEGQVNTFFAGNFYQAKNYLDWYGYAAPCPTPGTTGNYLFNLTALSQQLTDLTMENTCEDVIAAISQSDVIATASLSGKYTRASSQGDDLIITSTALPFDGDGKIANKYTCVGDGTSKNISIPLAWSNVPADTESLAIVMTDADADTTAGEPVAHWIAYDIPVTQNSLPENMPHLPLVHGAFQGMNDFGYMGYNGPCPDAGDGPHRYIFEIFALRQKLNVASTSMDYAKFLELMETNIEDHSIIIKSATLEGTYERTANSDNFTLTSTAFDFGQPIPSRYTCNGLNISPPLTWRNPPGGAALKSFAMLMTDFNSPVGSNAQWILYNIPKDVLSLDEFVPVGPAPDTPSGSAQAFNDFDVQGYSGPCPPSGNGAHHYVFKLVALDTATLAGNTYADIALAMQGHILGSVELNGTYESPTGGVGAFKLTSPAFADGTNLPPQYRSSYAYTKLGVETTVVGDLINYIIQKDNVKTCGGATINNDLQVTHNFENKNISPPLQWANVPAGTGSLMLFVKSSTAPDISAAPWEGNTHWVLYDIPPNLTGLDENVPQIPVTGNAYNGINDAPWGVGLTSPQPTPQTNLAGGIYSSYDDAYTAILQHHKESFYNGYWGPCRSGRYVFTLVALSDMLELNPLETTYANLIEKMIGKWVGTAEILTTNIAGMIITVPLNITVPVPDDNVPVEDNDAKVKVEYTATAVDDTYGTQSYPTATTNTQLTLNCTPISGGSFAIASSPHTVICTATNTATPPETTAESFTVTVVDITAPVITVPPFIMWGDDVDTETVNAQGAIIPEGTTMFSVVGEPSEDNDAVYAQDNVNLGLLPICTPAANSLFPLGTTTVTCKAADEAGNISSETFAVTVIDREPPVINNNEPLNDITASAVDANGAKVIFNVPAEDNVSTGADITITCTPYKSGDTFPYQVEDQEARPTVPVPTTETCIATDKAGNPSEAITFKVTVEDNTPPVITVPADMIKTTDADTLKVTFTVPVKDNVDVLVPVECDPASGSDFTATEAPGTITEVKCNAQDAAGNNAIEGKFNVIVIKNPPPTTPTGN
jgi:Raf kinase inhibitor-like YbhB/YbcL family protein